MVARLVRDEKVAGSNPVSPTKHLFQHVPTCIGTPENPASAPGFLYLPVSHHRRLSIPIWYACWYAACSIEPGIPKSHETIGYQAPANGRYHPCQSRTRSQNLPRTRRPGAVFSGEANRAKAVGTTVLETRLEGSFLAGPRAEPTLPCARRAGLQTGVGCMLRPLLLANRPNRWPLRDTGRAWHMQQPLTMQ